MLSTRNVSLISANLNGIVMRSAQVYRWQIPMDAGVVLRDRRLKTRDGLYVCLREGEREGWGEISPLPGFSQETWEDAQSVLLAG